MKYPKRYNYPTGGVIQNISINITSDHRDEIITPVKLKDDVFKVGDYVEVTGRSGYSAELGIGDIYQIDKADYTDKTLKLRKTNGNTHWIDMVDVKKTVKNTCKTCKYSSSNGNLSCPSDDTICLSPTRHKWEEYVEKPNVEKTCHTCKFGITNGDLPCPPGKLCLDTYHKWEEYIEDEQPKTQYKVGDKVKIIGYCEEDLATGSCNTTSWMGDYFGKILTLGDNLSEDVWCMSDADYRWKECWFEKASSAEDVQDWLELGCKVRVIDTNMYGFEGYISTIDRSYARGELEIYLTVVGEGKTRAKVTPEQIERV